MPVDNIYIATAIDDLAQVLGVHEPVYAYSFLSLLREGEVPECIRKVAQQLRLPVPIDFRYVAGHEFQSSDLVGTDRHGRGTGAIVAQVGMPAFLPPYGTPDLSRLSIPVAVSRTCTQYPLAFLTVIAHELTHIVLYSLYHKERDNEIYTDIAAMMLGFADVMRDGRKLIEVTKAKDGSSTTTTMTCGYLDDEQFNFAYKKIQAMIAEIRRPRERLGKLLSGASRQLNRFEATARKLEAYLLHLDQKRPTVMRGPDAERVVYLHQSAHVQEMADFIRNQRTTLSEVSAISGTSRSGTQPSRSLKCETGATSWKASNNPRGTGYGNSTRTFTCLRDTPSSCSGADTFTES